MPRPRCAAAAAAAAAPFMRVQHGKMETPRACATAFPCAVKQVGLSPAPVGAPHVSDAARDRMIPCGPTPWHMGQQRKRNLPCGYYYL